MKRIKPHSLFRVWSPDEVAECLPGIGNTELYAKLWNELVPLYDGKPRSEVPDDFSRRCLSKWWSKFTDDEKLKLNEAAAIHESENWHREKTAARIDGMDRDDLGESHDH